MQETRHTPQRATPFRPQASVSDMAVDGLLRGLAAGLAMLAVLIGATALAGMQPADVLASFGNGADARPFHGLLSHLAVSGAYGVLWGVLAGLYLRGAQTPIWLWGTLYGALLWGIAVLILPDASALMQIPWPILLAVHLVYGGALGLMQAASARPIS